MNKLVATLLSSLLFLLICSIICFAQSSDSTDIYNSQDSIIEKENFYPATGDTILRRRRFQSVHDSISVYKSRRDFGYMQYLDSLLKKAKSLVVDTINLDNIDQKKKVRSRSKQGSGDSILDSFFARALFWTLAICFIVFILYNLFLTESIFKRSPRRHIIPSAQQPAEHMLNPADYERMITEALVNKDFRLAIRYLYLQTLQKLSVAGFIHFTADKTNYEYVKELSGKPHQNEFASLTLNYEYVWYGRFNIDQNIFDRLQKDFKQYHQKL